MTDLIKRLRDTASKGVSVWGDLQMEAAAEIEQLRLAEEGAKEAFGHIVQMKQDAEQSVSMMEQTIRAQQGVFASFRIQLAEAQAEIERLRVDAERLDFMQHHLLRKGTMRFDETPGGNMAFKEVNAWSVASANTDLREALDAARAALENKHD